MEHLNGFIVTSRKIQFETHVVDARTILMKLGKCLADVHLAVTKVQKFGRENFCLLKQTFLLTAYC